MASYRSHSDGASRVSPSADTTAPSSCPACQSKSIATTVKVPDANSYWRCASCGEVWNASRRSVARSSRNSWR
jgi:predicted Zn finger-like uncharacterized protein